MGRELYVEMGSSYDTDYTIWQHLRQELLCVGKSDFCRKSGSDNGTYTIYICTSVEMMG